MATQLNHRITCSKRCAILMAAGTATSLAATSVASAQSAWNPLVASGGNWNVGNNWVPSGVPVSGTDLVLTFRNVYFPGGDTSTDNIAGNFNLNQMNLESQSTGTNVLNIAGSSNTLTFQTSSGNVGPSININDAGNSTIATSSSLLLAAGLNIGGSGIGQLTFSPVLGNSGAGSRDVTIAVNGASIVNWGAGISGTAPWAGNLNLNSGTLNLTGAGSLGSNTLVVNGGAFRFGTSSAIANAMTLNSELRVTAVTAINGILTGSLSGSGGLAFNSSNSLFLEGTSGFTGAVTANNGNTTTGTVTLRSTTGALTGATSYTIGAGYTLTLDNNTSGFNTNRVRDDATVTLNRANMTVTANGTAANIVNESIGTLAFSGMGQVTVNSSTSAGVGAATTLTASSLSRVNRGTLSVAGTAIGSGPAALGVGNVVVSTAPTGDLVGGGGAAGTTNQSILPYAFGRDLITASSMDASVVLGPNGLRPLTMNEYNQGLYALGGTVSQQNVAVRNDMTAGSNSGAWLDRNTTVNSLLLNGVSGGGNIASALYGPSAVTVGSGTVVFGTSGGAVANLGPATIAVGSLNFGSAEGIIHAAAAGSGTGGAAINSPITGSNGLTRSGFGVLALNGANTFLGPVTVNSGTLNISNDANLGDASNEIRLNGGVGTSTNAGGVVFLPTNVFGNGTSQAMSSARNVVLGDAGGAMSTASSNAELTLSGTVSGAGALVIGNVLASPTANGAVNLTGTNTHTGGTVVSSILNINSASALGTGSLTLSGGVLAPTTGTTSLTIGNTVGVNSSGTIYAPAGATVTVNGSVGGSGSFSRAGAGTVEFTVQNTMSGTLTSGSSTFAGTQNQPETGGRIVLRDGGAFSQVTGVNPANGGEIVLDNASSNLNNRLATANMTMNGGGLTLIGNAAAPTAEVMGTPTINANTGDNVITVAPNAAQNASLTFTSLTNSGTGQTLLVRGASLGSVPAAGVANVFIGSVPTAINGSNSIGTSNSPVLTNSVLPRVFVSTSATGSATDLATYSSTRGVQPLASYSAAFGATNNVNVNSAQVLGGATSANAVRMSPGSGIDVGANTLTVGTGELLVNADAGGNTITGAGGTLSLGTAPMIYNVTDLTLSGVAITGGTGLTKGGQGTLTLSSSNPALTGINVVSSGTLRLSAATSLPSAASVFLQPSMMGTAALDLAGNSVSIARVSGLGTVNLGTGGSLAVTNSFASFANVIGSGPVSGAALRLGGGGVMSGTSTYTGLTVFGGGTVSINSNQPASGAGPLGNSALQLGDAASTGNVTMALGSQVDFFDRDFSAPASASGGAPAASVIQLNTSGTATVNIGSNISLGRALTLGNSAGVTGFTAGQGTISGVISDNGASPGSIAFASGNWNLTGANSYTGGTTLNNSMGAMLGLGNDAALGAGAVSVGTGSATLRATGGARTISNPVSFTAAATNGLGFAGSNQLSLTGTIALGSTGQQLDVFNTAQTLLTGVISGGPGSGTGLTRTGGGTLVLTGANTYTGATRLSAGLTLANNLTGSAFGAGAVSVDSGAVLGGTGFIAGVVNIASGAVLSPGASAGTLNVGGLTSSAGSLFTFELLDSLVPTSSDLVIVNGLMAGIAGVVDARPLPGFAPGEFTLFTYTGANIPAGPGRGLSLTSDFLATWPSAQIIYVDGGGTLANSIVLSVPAPMTTSLLGLGLLVASRRRR